MNIRDYIIKLQGLSDIKKKVILWVTVGVLGIILIFIWINLAKTRLARLQEVDFSKDLNFPTNEINLGSNGEDILQTTSQSY